jgi:hypothetical protein
MVEFNDARIDYLEARRDIRIHPDTVNSYGIS